jgi:hypothetical protein
VLLQLADEARVATPSMSLSPASAAEAQVHAIHRYQAVTFLDPGLFRGTAARHRLDQQSQ